MLLSIAEVGGGGGGAASAGAASAAGGGDDGAPRSLPRSPSFAAPCTTMTWEEAQREFEYDYDFGGGQRRGSSPGSQVRHTTRHRRIWCVNATR